MERTGRLDRNGTGIAWRHRAGKAPTVVFLPGFASDMGGTKASLLAAHCEKRARAMLRFDYSGHGESGGRFEDGTIGSWTEDALAVIDAESRGKLLLVGSSMGGWVALLVALARPKRVAGLLGIAPAPDFTESLVWEALMPEQQEALMETGRMEVPSEYGAPLVITLGLIEEGRTHLLLRKDIGITCPVRLLHGQRDEDVPWKTSLRLSDALTSADVQVTLIKDGDHRLSRPADLALLTRTLDALLGTLGGEDRA